MGQKVLSLKRPEGAGQRLKAGKAVKLAEGETRFVANLPTRIHQQIRERVTELRISQREYLLRLLKKEGIE